MADLIVLNSKNTAWANQQRKELVKLFREGFGFVAARQAAAFPVRVASTRSL